MIRQIVSFWTEEKSLSVFLVLLVLQIFVVGPLKTDNTLLLSMTNGVLGSLFFLTGLLTITQHRWTCWFASGLVMAALAVRWLVLLAPSDHLMVADNLIATCYAACFTVIVLKMVYRGGPVSGHRVRGAIAAYLLIGFFFATAYRLLDDLIPGAFSHPAHAITGQQAQEIASSFMYFSLVTLTTVGFGDIAAVHPVARSLVTLEAVIGTLYPAILIARLVSLQITQENTPQKTGEGPV